MVSFFLATAGATATKPSFAPNLYEQLAQQEWGRENGKYFDQRVHAARSGVVALKEEETILKQIEHRGQLSFAASTRNLLAFYCHEYPELYIRLLRNKRAFPFQAMSYLLRAHHLKKVVAQYPDLTQHIMVPSVYAVHRRGLLTYGTRPSRLLLDGNYVIVEKRVGNLPSLTENEKRFACMSLSFALAGIQTINRVGLWSVNLLNTHIVTIVERQQKTKVPRNKLLFTSFLLPNDGTYNAHEYFDRSPAVMARLAQRGLHAFARLLPLRVLTHVRICAALGEQLWRIAVTERDCKIVDK